MLRMIRRASAVGFVVAGLVVSGCASSAPSANNSARSNVPERAAEKTKPQLIVTPEPRLVGSVIAYNPAGRFVVIEFPVGNLPVRDQRLAVYRQGLKVGEVRITGPERDYSTVADVISGEALKGDEIREY